jgi:hypothetical protein
LGLDQLLLSILQLRLEADVSLPQGQQLPLHGHGKLEALQEERKLVFGQKKKRNSEKEVEVYLSQNRCPLGDQDVSRKLGHIHQTSTRA